MPAIDFFSDKEDERFLLETLLDLGVKFVPDLHYEGQKISTLDSYDSVLQGRERERHFFLIHPEFTAEPLEVREIAKEGKKEYFIMPKNGGPALDLLLDTEVPDSTPPTLAPGSLSYYRTFWSNRERMNKPAPSAQKEIYRQFCARVRESFVEIKPGIRRYWIGPGAGLKVKSGWRLLGLENYRLDRYFR